MKIALIDLFCGAGGTTTGVERATKLGRKIAKVIACVNHDAMAIKSHRANHKGVLHFTEDIRTLNLNRLLKLVQRYRDQGYVIAIWASLECTNFSNAKGGLARDPDSRTLAEHLVRYITEISPDLVYIENVMEFMAWGPLISVTVKDEHGVESCPINYSVKSNVLRVVWKGKPESRDKGKSYLRWVESIKELGYEHDWRKLDSADFGAHTSRKRYFGIFAKTGLPIVFPQATHAKKPVATDLFAKPLKKWKAVREVLQLEKEGQSIFSRNKPLSDKTLLRIHAGLEKYVAGGQDAFIAKYFSGRPAGKVISTEGPAGTITCVDGQALVKAKPFLLKYNSTSQAGKHIPPSVDVPCPVIACQNRLGIVNTQFLAKYYSNGGELQSIEEPGATLPTKDRLSMITAKPFMLSTHFDNVGRSLDQPAPVITANRKYNYIVNPSWFGNPHSIDNPACTVVARQDKAPLYLLTAACGSFKIPVHEGDSEAMVKIKQFMAAHGIVDIKMRMLNVTELLRIQGFPKGYKLEGTQAQKKKFIGNSVVPIMSKLLIKETHQALTELQTNTNTAAA